MIESEYLKSINPKYRKLGNIFKVGNKKIGNDTIIFNMQPAYRCISKILGLCQLSNSNNCYALRDEHQYKQVLEYRKRQQKYWKDAPIDIILKDIIHIKQVRPKIKYIRFNESGDIIDLLDINKLNYLANKLKDHDILVYTYTARSDIFKRNTITLSDNLVINGSGFMVHNNFKVITEPLHTTGLLCVGHCKECVYCKTRLNKVIHVEFISNKKKVL